MKLTAVIPVRKGSERVPNKSLRKFGSTNLLKLKIKELLNVQLIDNIVVNTDSEEAIEIARQMNVDFHVRKPYYASSKCSNSQFLTYLGETTNTDIFAYCPVTSPFIKHQTITNCIEEFLQSKNDSLATVSSIKEFLWLYNKPINYTLDNQPNSQNLPPIKALNFGLNLIRRTDLLKFKNIVGIDPKFIELDEIEGIDIDTPFDFFIAEQVFLKQTEDNNFLAYIK